MFSPKKIEFYWDCISRIDKNLNVVFQKVLPSESPFWRHFPNFEFDVSQSKYSKAHNLVCLQQEEVCTCEYGIGTTNYISLFFTGNSSKCSFKLYSIKFCKCKTFNLYISFYMHWMCAMCIEHCTCLSDLEE